MSVDETVGRVSAARLQRLFDVSFAEPRREPVSQEKFLAIRIAGQPYAVRVSQLASVHADREIVPIPGPEPALLGLAGVRGTVVPIYDLRLLLGHCVSPAAPRWIAIGALEPRLAVAFDELEACTEAPGETAQPETGSPGIVRGTISLGGVTRPIVDFSALVQWLTEEARSKPKEPS